MILTANKNVKGGERRGIKENYIIQSCCNTPKHFNCNNCYSNTKGPQA